MTTMNGIYLDHNATTPVDLRVLAVMRPWFDDSFGNASSVHQWGQRAAAAVDEARRTLSGILDCAPSEIVFTSGGTEADNLAVQGVGRALRSTGHLVVSAIEHKATLAAAHILEEAGMSLTLVPASPEGVVDAEAVTLAMREDTVLVSVMLANNETGAIQPVGEIARIAHDAGALFHCDAVQALGKIPVDRAALDADLMAFSAHKIYGPKGVGALYVREGTELAPLIAGGTQELGHRGGTTNVPLVVGFAEAARIAAAEQGLEAARLTAWTETFIEGVTSALPEIRFFGNRGHRLPGTVNLGFPGLDGSVLVQAFDMAGIAASTGSACQAGATEPSHVLRAMGLPEEEAVGAVRFSFGRLNTAEQVDDAIQRVVTVARGLKESV